MKSRIKYLNLSRFVRLHRVILVLCTVYCLTYNPWSSGPSPDPSSKQSKEIKLSHDNDIPDLERAQCSPVDTPPSQDGVTIVSYGRDTPDHHGYMELSSVIAGDPALLDGVHASVGVLQGIVNNKLSSEMLHVFKHTSTAVISLVNVAANAVRDNEKGVDVMLRYLMEHVQSIKWVGLGAQSYVVSTINGVKVGFTAVCISHTECAQETVNYQSSLLPVKYHVYTFTFTVKKLRELGATFIVVLAYWGRQHMVLPEDHTLLIAKQMSTIGASVIIGNHPRLVQDHAYMGNTLVIFSQGNVAINKNDLCWTEEHFREEVRSCRLVHPQLREELKNNERKMRLYKIILSSNGMVHGDYMTFELEESAWKTSYLKAVHTNKQWIRACSHSDPHCLTCKYF